MAVEPAPLEIEDEFYEILAGGTKLSLLASVLDLGVDQVLVASPGIDVAGLVTQFGLHPIRAAKWVLLLRETGIVRELAGATGSAPRYVAGPLLRALVIPSAGSYFYREFLRYWRRATSIDPASLVRGADVPDPVRYPPVAWDDVVLLHEWMRSGALLTLSTIERVFDFSRVTRILDVGGGDGAMACALATKHPNVQITVFNLPAPAFMCNQNLAAAKLEGRVHVHEGDFRTDTLPVGFDLVMFSRVMADWDPATCRRLAAMAHTSLVPDGQLLVAEPLSDENPHLAIAWEHSYLPYDDFGVHVYKPLALYRELFAAAGFVDLQVHPRGDSSIHTVMVSRKASP